MSTDSLATVAVEKKALTTAIILCLALQAWLALVTEINWDEFFYLSQIYSYQHGELTLALQTFHVHLLSWLTRMPGDEIDQVVTGRLVMLTCETGTSVLIYKLARGFFGPEAALLTVLVFVSAAFTMVHGASFRADPLATLLLMGALVIIARSRPSLLSALGAAILVAVATMVTIKVALYAPAFVSIAIWRAANSDDRMSLIIWLARATLLTAVAFTILYVAHLGVLPKATNTGSGVGLGNAAQTQTGAGFLPRSRELIQFVLLSPVQAMLLVAGFVATALSLVQRPTTNFAAVAIMGCGATVLCLLFYRNAFPYFFPFILAPSVLLAGAAAERILMVSRHPLLLVIGLAVPAIAVASAWSRHDQIVQRQLVSTVHRTFPIPVAYIDRNSMIASFRQRGFFMSTWGIANYRRGPPVFSNVLSHDTVPFLIADGPALEAATGMNSRVSPEFRLRQQDDEVLRQNYIPHWGRIWVAGKRLAATPAGTTFVISIPGIYTVEGGAVRIDRSNLAAGGVLNLVRGAHVISSPKPVIVTLRWGDHLYKPSYPPRPGAIYKGF